MEDKKKLKRMATWTIAVFATIFAVVMAVMWLVSYPADGGSPFHIIGTILGMTWYAILLSALLCFAVYFVYSFYLSKKRKE